MEIKGMSGERIHVCTSESFIVHEIEPMHKVCPICGQITEQRVTWTGVLCMGCRREYGPDYSLAYIVRKRREILGLTKREMGKRLGYTKGTVHQYEWGDGPSQIYVDKSLQLVKEMGDG